MKNTFDNNVLDIITPIKIELDWPSRDELVETLRYQKEHYGIRRFALGAPSLGWKSEGFPPMAHFEALAELFSQVRDAVREDGISCGYLNMLTVRSGASALFTPIIRSDGTEAPAASCPLDPAFQKALAESTAHFARLAQPEFIFFEDDYSINAQTPDGLGCFCPHHLQEFSRRCGKEYTREELAELLQQRTPEHLTLLKKWRELIRDSMVALSRAVRKEVDRYTPEIPIGSMQPVSCDRDGDSTEAVARALAGPNHTPFSRIYGTVYCDLSNAKNIPEVLFHPLYTRQHIRGDFCFYHESDTFPHTRFFVSAKKMRGIMASAYSMAFDGSTFQTAQMLDDRNEERAFGMMLRQERQRFNAVSNIAKRCRLRGVQIDYDPFRNTLDGGSARPYWTRCVSLFGIPYTAEEARVTFWDARQAKYANHETVMQCLSKGLFLDGAAAKELCRRGYGPYLGIEVGENVATGLFALDDAAREVIQPPFDHLSKGRNMAAAQVYASRRNGKPLEIKITDPSVEVITQLCNFRKEFVTPAMVRFENTLGGRIVVMGMTLEDNISHSLFNYRRQRLFHELVKWCGDDCVFVENEPNIFVIMNEAADRDADGFLGMLTLTNLGDDPVCGVKLHLPPTWQTAKHLKVLNREARWVSVNWARTADTLTISDTLDHCDPMYLLVE